MAFSDSKNQVFHERMRNCMRSLYEVAFDEGERLDNIYLNEAASGADEAFQDTDIADAAECVEGIVLIRALQTFLTDHVARMTPFLQ